MSACDDILGGGFGCGDPDGPGVETELGGAPALQALLVPAAYASLHEGAASPVMYIHVDPLPEQPLVVRPHCAGLNFNPSQFTFQQSKAGHDDLHKW
jgi:hypothetical protein